MFLNCQHAFFFYWCASRTIQSVTHASSVDSLHVAYKKCNEQIIDNSDGIFTSKILFIQENFKLNRLQVDFLLTPYWYWQVCVEFTFQLL